MKPSEAASLATGTPPAEFTIDEALVHRLLTDQCPDLAHLPLRMVDSGWDNAMFRLGDRLVARLPRRAFAAPLIAHEQRLLPGLAKQVSLPIPAPHRLGKPALGYPWPWSVSPWLKGTTADQDEPASTQAAPFGQFLRSLHLYQLADPLKNPFRGVPLRERAPTLEARMNRVAARTNLVTPKIRQIWSLALEAPFDGAISCLHGDLHPRNVLVDQGIITGIIDWGDITVGDAATDLASSWLLFDDPRDRQRLFTAYDNPSEPTLLRAKGWAVLFGVMLLDAGLVDNPPHAAIGERILRRLG